MTNRTIKSNGVTFVDMSDKRKLEVHISCNLPTVQIFDNNSGLYTPDWSKTNLTLEARVYLDANDITDKITAFTWSGVGGISSGAKYTIKSNVLSPTTSIQTYSCEVTYDGLTTRSQMDFSRVENGSNGTVGAILGSYNTLADLKATHPTGDKGDTYLVQGELYVWCLDNNDWQGVGNIQGPAGYTPIKGIDYRDGVDGQTYYVHIRYSANADGSSMTATPQSNTQYMGTCSTTSGTAPTTNTSYTWALIKGSTGASGANGTSYYVHIRYKESEESTTLLTTPSNYMGVYSGTSSTAPTTINSYTWYNTKGDVGAPGEAAVTFQVYSENGYILSKDTQRITLQTFAYVGDTKITADATYQWYTVSNGIDTAIAGATEPSYDVVHSDIEFRNVYKCIMVFNGIEYVGLVTIEDKNDLVTTFTTKPTSYSAGDIWVVGTDVSESDIPTGVTYGEILKAEHANTTYSKDDWIPATRYDQILKELKESTNKYDQFFSFDSNTGLNIKAVDANGNASQFSTTLSSDRLSFNQSNEAIAYISGSKMHIKEAEIISPLTVTGKYSGSTMQQAPTINLGGFSLVVESNGSLSIISNN